MQSASDKHFKRNYETHLKYLRLKGLQPKTIEAYGRAIRRIGAYFDHRIDTLCEQQLTDYFTDLLASHSWSNVSHCPYEFLQAKGFEFIIAKEAALAKAAIAQLRWPLEPVPSRRQRTDCRSNAIDLRASLHGGAPGIELRRCSRRRRQPALVILCDISASISSYSHMFLHFVHATVRLMNRRIRFCLALD